MLPVFNASVNAGARSTLNLVSRGGPSSGWCLDHCLHQRLGRSASSVHFEVNSAPRLFSARSSLTKLNWFSTTSVTRESETDRVTQAYLRDVAMKSVRKHDGNRLVYEVRGQLMLRVVSVVFYATAAVGIYVTPDFVVSALENEVLNQETVTNLVAVSFAIVGLPSLLRMLSKRLILKLYHNEARESYLAITQSLYLTNKMTKFSLADVVVTEKKGVLNTAFNLTSFKARKQPFHVNPYNFKLPSDYNHLFGYDRM